MLEMRPYEIVKVEGEAHAESVSANAWRWGLAVVAIVALLLRLLFIFQWLKTPLSQVPVVDAKMYNSWALAIASGHLLRERAFYQSPFYPYLLALIYKIFGHRQVLVFILQAFAGTATCLVIAKTAKTVFGALPGLVAGGIAAVYAPFIFQTGVLQKETWGILGFSLFVYFAIRAERSCRRSDFLLCGLMLGWTALSRGNVLLLGPLLAVWWFWRTRGAVIESVVFLLGAMIAVAPATAHNWMVSRDFVLINYPSGFVFYLGNRASAGGLGLWPEDISAIPAQEEIDTTRIAERGVGRTLKPSQVSWFWTSRALRIIRDSPTQWLGLMSRKAWLYWRDYEEPDAYDLQFISKVFPTFLRYPLISFGVVSVLAALGILICFRNCGLLLLITFGYMATALLFYISDRYRLPQVVPLFPLCGAGACGFYGLLRRKEWVRIYGSLFVAALVGGLCWGQAVPNRTTNEAAAWGMLAGVNYDLGLYKECLDSLNQGLSLRPPEVGDYAVTKGAVAAENLGDAAAAARLYETGARLYPRSASLYNRYGMFLFKQGRPREALLAFQRTVNIDPGAGLTFRNMFVVYSAMGDQKSALAAGRKAMELLPGDQEMSLAFKKLRQSH